MHEVSLAEGILKTVTEIAKTQNAQRITTIYLKIGKLSGIAQDPLEFAFEAISRDSIAQNAKLVFEVPQIVLQCTKCNVDVKTKNFPAPCPKCGSTCVQIKSGFEFEILSMEIE
ncbi:MAG: hydrogenase maturation nickel metallochaperone HypA [Candidatus Riflebacteria bacterium]|nr:hydrogenase maturation nickel metallochaperone HypA [Candidatus Riflebacteria bacterium]